MMKISPRPKIVILAVCLVAVCGIVYTLRYDFGQLILSFPPLKEYIDREIHQTMRKEIASRPRNRIDLNFFQKFGAALLEKNLVLQRTPGGTSYVPYIKLTQHSSWPKILQTFLGDPLCDLVSLFKISFWVIL
ncbi:MAG: hypothetical protein A2Z51_10980 [Deltaproteobacteria bacterium RBG_19FT_COMBO_52_11]|nr:MAG: hypothetical protein A2Z51_10980 [Deltaproteobacteria bacterium RBG_19FT_COMBO_52_11]